MRSRQKVIGERVIHRYEKLFVETSFRLFNKYVQQRLLLGEESLVNSQARNLRDKVSPPEEYHRNNLAQKFIPFKGRDYKALFDWEMFNSVAVCGVWHLIICQFELPILTRRQKGGAEWMKGPAAMVGPHDNCGK